MTLCWFVISLNRADAQSVSKGCTLQKKALERFREVNQRLNSPCNWRQTGTDSALAYDGTYTATMFTAKPSAHPQRPLRIAHPGASGTMDNRPRAADRTVRQRLEALG